MHRWLDDLAGLPAASLPAVLVTVEGVRGSAPREPGARMVVTADASIGTIGGGQLEYQCSRIAVERVLAGDADFARRLRRRFPLGSNCGQCCGGVVDVVFERVGPGERWLAELSRLRGERCPVVLATPADETSAPVLVTDGDVLSFAGTAALSDGVAERARALLDGDGAPALDEGWLLQPVLPNRFNVALFGAGHVGAATAQLLAGLDCRVRWIDSRRGIFPAALPANVTAVETERPAREVAAMPPGTYFLVMTHSHPLDFEICGRVLLRDDAAYCGLIGSRSKRRRFEAALRKQGVPEARVQRLTCPIGIPGITGKRPADIAVAVCAELLQTRDAAAPAMRDNDPAARHGGTNVRAI